MRKKGFFITFEGIDGCGKSTQSALLVDRLCERYGVSSVLKTHEPGGWSGGQELRQLLLHGDLRHPQSELFLFAYDRCEHSAHVILPALQQGQIVVCERFHDSTIAYQGYGRGFSQDFLFKIAEVASFPEPNIVIFLDLSVQRAAERLRDRGKMDRFERCGPEYFTRVREGFMDLSKKSVGSEWVHVDAEACVPEVHKRIWTEVQSRVESALC